MFSIYPVLRQLIRKYGVTLGELAAVIDISTIVLCLKLWGIKQWKLTEVVKICCFFNTTDTERLFQKESVLNVLKQYITNRTECQ